MPIRALLVYVDTRIANPRKHEFYLSFRAFVPSRFRAN